MLAFLQDQGLLFFYHSSSFSYLENNTTSLSLEFCQNLFPSNQISCFRIVAVEQNLVVLLLLAVFTSAAIFTAVKTSSESFFVHWQNLFWYCSSVLKGYNKNEASIPKMWQKCQGNDRKPPRIKVTLVSLLSHHYCCLQGHTAVTKAK